MIRKLLITAAACLFTFQAFAIDTLISIPLDSTSVVLPCIVLLDIGETIPGAIAQTGITAAETGLEIKVRADVTDGWHAEHVTATINVITGTIGEFETPDANDVHFEEVAASTGCYQLILPDSYYTLDDGGTNCNSGPCDAKELTILIRDVTSPAFADTWVKVALNVTSSETLVDLIWDEPASGHATAGTSGDSVYIDIPAIADDTASSIPALLTVTTRAATRNFVYSADVDSIVSQTVFAVAAGDSPGANGWHVGRWLCVEDADDEDTQDCARIVTYDHSNLEWGIANALKFTVAAGDEIFIKAPSSDLLGASEITASVIATDAIGAAEIAANAIGASELAGDAITAGTIAADAIGASEIATGAIDADAIADGAIAAQLQITTIATLASQVSFTLTAGSTDDDAYNGATIVITDASTGVQKAVSTIVDYTGSSKTVRLAFDPAIFTMATTDKVAIIVGQ